VKLAATTYGAFVDIDRVVRELRLENHRWRVGNPLRLDPRERDVRRDQVLGRGWVRVDVKTGINAQRYQQHVAGTVHSIHSDVSPGAAAPRRPGTWT
jgi:hypothetical protein